MNTEPITNKDIRLWCEANDVADADIDSWAVSTSYAVVVLTFEDGTTKNVTESEIRAAASAA